MNITEQFQAVSTLFDNNGDPQQLRTKILDLILESLEDRKASFGYWEKFCLGGAISALATTLSHSNTSSTLWLNLCMVNLHQTFTPPNQRNENYTPRRAELGRMTYEQFVEAANSLRDQI